MSWKKPEFVEIKMDAEVSSYQGDDDWEVIREARHSDKPPRVEPAE